MKTFASWINEYADFGLGMQNQKKDPEPKNQEDPLMPLSVEYVTNSLRKVMLGEKYVIPNDFFGDMQWGNQDGALLLAFSNFGGNRAVIRKLIHDLEGEPRWICKKVIEVKNLFDDKPDTLIFKIRENLEKIDYEGLDAPIPDFEDFQRMVITIASTLRRQTTQRIFMYEGIRVIKENEKYIIHFGVTGMGVQRRDQKRLDQFAIHAEYHKKAGLIKITGTPLGDKIAQHRWIYDPSNFIEWFSPKQGEEEISRAMLHHFNCY
jgi:hypothetical protein